MIDNHLRIMMSIWDGIKVPKIRHLVKELTLKKKPGHSQETVTMYSGGKNALNDGHTNKT